MEVTINVTVGNDTEGLKIAPQLTNVLWTGLNDAQVANGSRGSIKNLLMFLYMLKNPTAPAAQAQQFINQYTTETH